MYLTSNGVRLAYDDIIVIIVAENSMMRKISEISTVITNFGSPITVIIPPGSIFADADYKYTYKIAGDDNPKYTDSGKCGDGTCHIRHLVSKSMADIKLQIDLKNRKGDEARLSMRICEIGMTILHNFFDSENETFLLDMSSMKIEVKNGKAALVFRENKMPFRMTVNVTDADGRVIPVRMIFSCCCSQ